MRIIISILSSLICLVSCAEPFNMSLLSVDNIDLFYRENRNSDFINRSIKLSAVDKQKMHDWINSIMLDYEASKSYVSFAPGLLMIRSKNFNVNVLQDVVILSVSTRECHRQFARSLTEEDRKLMIYFHTMGNDLAPFSATN